MKIHLSSVVKNLAIFGAVFAFLKYKGSDLRMTTSSIIAIVIAFILFTMIDSLVQSKRAKNRKEKSDQ